jgi:hypothetical protein
MHESLLERWVNIYRADDFVGRQVDGHPSSPPNNVPIGPRGHVNYWSDREVLDHLVRSDHRLL